MVKDTILIVEDDPDVLNINEIFLTSKGYNILKATTVQKARDYLVETKLDLILLDVNLPDGSGIDFCRDELQFSSVPVIFLTCNDRDEDKVNGLMQGGDDYITKPYILNELHARIEAVLRRTRSHERIIKIKPYEINIRAEKVLLNGNDCLLNHKEFKLFMILLENTGKIIDRDTLYQRVWNQLSITSSVINTVNVNISTLRKKLFLHEYDTIQIYSIRLGGYCLHISKEDEL